MLVRDVLQSGVNIDIMDEDMDSLFVGNGSPEKLFDRSVASSEIMSPEEYESKILLGGCITTSNVFAYPDLPVLVIIVK